MARDIMNVTGVARLTSDPELRHTKGGTAVTDLRLAWSTDAPDGSGGYQEHSNFGDFTLWGKAAENAAQYLTKGRQVAVQGGLQMDEWTADDGTKRSKLKVNVRECQWLGGNGENQSSGGSAKKEGSDLPVTETTQATPGNTGGDDDIPF